MDEGPLAKLLPSIGTLVVLLAYSKSIQLVAAGRAKFNIAPPSTQGPPGFQQVLRAQQNTLEYIVVVIPLIWLNAILLPGWGPWFSFVGGLVWACSRYLYIVGYAEAPEKRVRGFYGSLLATNGLSITALLGCLYQLGLWLET